VSGQPWQVLADCAHCRVEAAVVEWMDPLVAVCARGIPAERRCRACGATERPDDAGVLQIVAAPAAMAEPAVARAALARWAGEEGEADLEQFCRGNLGGSLDEVVGKLGRAEVVGTTFDVIAFLFPGGGGGGSSGSAAADPGLPRIVDGQPEVPAPATPVAPAPMDAHTPARFLVSVMVADGDLRAGERTFVVRFLERRGLPPLSPSDLRVWRPTELGTPPDATLAHELVEAAVHLMHLDRGRDGSEWRVIRAFAAAWGVRDDHVERWDREYGRRYTTAMARLGRILTGWLS
jgi:hypothetical protein